MEFGIKEFSSEQVGIDEIEDFYRINEDRIPTTRPYIWTNTVTSLDSVCGFGEDEVLGEMNVGFRSALDFRLLNAGWAKADAVLTTGEILRTELEIYYTPRDDDLKLWRKGMSKPERFEDHPIQIIITKSGDLDFSHPLFSQSSLKIVIITTPNGAKTCKKNIEDFPKSETLNPIEFLLSTTNEKLNIQSMMTILRTQMDIKFLEVDGGGTLQTFLIQEKLIDEIRVTQSGQLLGPFDSKGNPRPKFFSPPIPFFNFISNGNGNSNSNSNSNRKDEISSSSSSSLMPSSSFQSNSFPSFSFKVNNTPLTKFVGLRYFKQDLLFVRYFVTYRH